MPHPVHSSAYRGFLELLRAAREKAGLKQVEVAERLNKPQSYVSKSESGERRVDIVEAAEFARVYGVSLDQLVPGNRRRPRARRSR
jgi:transcriptional regulator with XRE-family HTH domain